MCDTSPVRNWLAAALASVLLAVAAIVIAVLLNSSIWETKEAPAAMLAAAALTGLAMLACRAALLSLDSVCACLAPQCAGECTNLRNLTYATQVVLGIQTTAALAAAIPALIPFVGEAPMKVIAGALVVQSVLLVSHIVFVADLDKCATQAAADNNPAMVVVPGPISTGLTASDWRLRRRSWRTFWKRFWR